MLPSSLCYLSARVQPLDQHTLPIPPTATPSPVFSPFHPLLPSLGHQRLPSPSVCTPNFFACFCSHSFFVLFFVSFPLLPSFSLSGSFFSRRRQCMSVCTRTVGSCSKGGQLNMTLFKCLFSPPRSFFCHIIHNCLGSPPPFPCPLVSLRLLIPHSLFRGGVEKRWRSEVYAHGVPTAVHNSSFLPCHRQQSVLTQSPTKTSPNSAS